MIIFDYATLADDSHRRYLIDPNHNENYWNDRELWDFTCQADGWYDRWKNKKTGKQDFKPDYAAYYAAAKDDTPIKCIDKLLEYLKTETPENLSMPFEIWADFPVSMEDKLRTWFYKNSRVYSWDIIRLRPSGDTTPWHELKEKWILDFLERVPQSDLQVSVTPKSAIFTEILRWKNKIEMAFERSGSPMIEVWKKYGVPVMEVHI